MQFMEGSGTKEPDSEWKGQRQVSNNKQMCANRMDNREPTKSSN